MFRVYIIAFLYRPSCSTPVSANTRIGDEPTNHQRQLSLLPAEGRLNEYQFQVEQCNRWRRWTSTPCSLSDTTFLRPQSVFHCLPFQTYLYRSPFPYRHSLPSTDLTEYLAAGVWKSLAVLLLVQEIWANAHETRHSISLISYACCLGLSPVYFSDNSL